MWKHELFGGDMIEPFKGHLVTMVRHLESAFAAECWQMRVAAVSKKQSNWWVVRAVFGLNGKAVAAML